jgi:plasmid stabilization system protein ParE
MKRVVAGLLLAATSLVACGSQPEFTATVSDNLSQRVERIETYIADGELDTAKTALLSLQKKVARLLEQDRIGQERASRILSAITVILGRVERLIAESPLPTTTVVVTETATVEPSATATVTVTESPEEEDEDHGKDKKNKHEDED